MTTHRNDFHGQTAGVTVSAANSASSGDAFTSVGISGTGALTYAADPAGGGRSTIHAVPQSGNSCFVRDASYASTQVSISDCFYYAGLPSAEQVVFQIFNASTLGIAVLLVSTAGKMRLRNSAGSFIADGTDTLTAGHWYRIEAQVFSDATAGTFNAQWYIDDGTTQTGSASGTALNTRGGNITIIDRGPNSPTYASAATSWYYTNLQAQDGTLTPLGRFATQIATPTVTLATTTNPSTPGGTDGSQVVTWGALTGATSYEAWIASGSSPAQTDFTLKATGVTSPYTFTGLAAGTYSFGIKAKA